jgi:hypothetical protein
MTALLSGTPDGVHPPSSSTWPTAGCTGSSAAGAGMRSDSGSNTSQQIASWVEQNFEATSVGDVTLYDLTRTARLTFAASCCRRGVLQ